MSELSPDNHYDFNVKDALQSQTSFVDNIAPLTEIEQSRPLPPSTHTIHAQIPRMMSSSPKLGILRIDYWEKAHIMGDVDHPDSYDYETCGRIVPGLTFEMCQKSFMPDEVKTEFLKAIDYLVDEMGVCGITGNCGFMMNFQELARQHSRVPVFMSSLVQLPAVTCSFAKHDQIIIATANGKSLEAMHDLIVKECNTEVYDSRFVTLCAQEVPGFEAVLNKEKVDEEKVRPGVVELCQKAMERHPAARAFLFECTELGPYSDAVREATGLPVFDAITNCDFFVDTFQRRMHRKLMGRKNLNSNFKLY